MSWPADGKPRFVVAHTAVLDRAFSHRIVAVYGSGSWSDKLAAAVRAGELNAEQVTA